MKTFLKILGVVCLMAITGLCVYLGCNWDTIVHGSGQGPANPDPVDPDWSGTMGEEIKDFKFDGDTIIKYTGDAVELTLPLSYSLGQVTIETMTYDDFDELYMGIRENLGEDAYPLELQDAGGHKVTVNGEEELWELRGFGEEESTLAYPVSFQAPVQHYVKGGDIKVKNVMGAFNRVQTLQKVIIPEGFTEVGNGAFFACDNIESVKLPSTLKVIGPNAFDGLPKLTELDLPVGLEKIGLGAFADTGISTLTLPNTIKELNSSFWRMIKLTKLNGFTELPLTELTRGLFLGCDSLVTIELPPTVTIIGESAFYGCENLQSLHLPDGVTTIGKEAFFECYALTDINLHEGIIRIDRGAFYDCQKLENVTLPSTLQYYGAEAFYHTKVKSLVLPQALTTLCYSAFEGMRELVKVFIPDYAELTIEAVHGADQYLFNYTPTNLKIYCASSSKPSWAGENTLTRFSPRTSIPIVYNATLEQFNAA